MPEMPYFIRHSSSDFYGIEMEFLDFFGFFGIFCLKIPYLEFTTPIFSRVSPLGEMYGKNGTT
jgi:hypothetical protein